MTVRGHIFPPTEDLCIVGWLSSAAIDVAKIAIIDPFDMNDRDEDKEDEKEDEGGGVEKPIVKTKAIRPRKRWTQKARSMGDAFTYGSVIKLAIHEEKLAEDRRRWNEKIDFDREQSRLRRKKR